MKHEEQYRHVLENTLGIPFTMHNSVDVLVNGKEIFPAMLDAIRHAEKHVDFLTFVYWSGKVAEDVAHALARKADEGVQVRVILDSYGAASISRELVDLMTDNGVQLRWIRPFSQWKVWQNDNRTHRKILICDCNIGFTGGVGIAEEWVGDARNPSEYRDTHFRIKGEAVKGLQAAFLENWIETEDTFSLDPSWEDGLQAHSVDGGDIAIQVIRTAVSERWSDIVMLYETLIKIAQDSIYITTAYFNPNDIMIDVLSEAVDRGVEVSIIMPGKYNDMRLAKLAGEETMGELLDNGVQLWYYQKTMYHTKKIIVDRTVSCIGSANFNHRSMLKDDEINLVCINKELAEKLIKNVKDDLKDSERINKEMWEKRSLIRRGVEKFVTLGRKEI